MYQQPSSYDSCHHKVLCSAYILIQVKYIVSLLIKASQYLCDFESMGLENSMNLALFANVFIWHQREHLLFYQRKSAAGYETISSVHWNRLSLSHTQTR